MEAPERGALMLVRFVAVALIGWAIVDLSLYWIVRSHNNQPLAIGTCLLKALPLIAGAVILICSKSLAEWLSDKLDL